MRHAGDSGRVQAAPARRERIVRLLLVRGSVSTEDIGREIGASAATVRRDLTLLARQGRLVRHHGGATAATAAANPAPANSAPAGPPAADVVRELEAGVALPRAADSGGPAVVTLPFNVAGPETCAPSIASTASVPFGRQWALHRRLVHHHRAGSGRRQRAAHGGPGRQDRRPGGHPDRAGHGGPVEAQHHPGRHREPRRGPAGDGTRAGRRHLEGDGRIRCGVADAVGGRPRLPPAPRFRPHRRLLPTVPDGWRDGHFTGLRARGGVTVDCHWADGVPREVSMTATADRTVVLRFGNRLRTLQLPAHVTRCVTLR